MRPLRTPFDQTAPPRPTTAAVQAGLAETEPDFHIGEYLGKLRRRWKLIALCVLIGIIGGIVHFMVTPKAYEARARIQIERRSMSLLSGSQNPWLENYWNLEFYPTQYQLLSSRGLAERVVLELGLADDAFFNPTGTALEVPAGAEIDPEDADAKVLGTLAGRLLGGLEVTPVGNTQLVDIVYHSASPDFAARTANGFAAAFINWGIENRTDTAGRASSFLTGQIDDLKREIQAKESQLQDLSRQIDLISLDRDSNVNLQQLESYNRDYMEAKGARIQKYTAYQELLDAPRQDVADRISNGTVSQLIRDNFNLETEYRSKLEKYKEDWPEMVELKAKIDAGQANIDRTVSANFERAKQLAWAEYQTALRREQALEAELTDSKSELLDQSSAAVQLTNLQLEIQSSRELLEKLLNQQSETEVTARLQDTRESNVRIVDRALVPGGPSRPSLRTDLSSGLLLGLFVGVGGVVLLDYLDRTLKTADEVERRLGLPNLAVIPDIAGGGRSYGGYGYGYGARRRPIERRDAAEDKIELLPHERPRLAISEAYRALRTSLLLASAQELKLVAITSAGAGEGKTATSTNLAIVMAQLGRRVLLVDADLRKPRLHQVFGVSNRSGLVSILAGGEPLDQVVMPSGIPNLYLVPSGPVPPNPSELLASERMAELTRRARGQFDFVVIDTPPVLAVTDATLVGAMADGVILCLRAGKVLREEARACRDRLLMAEVKVLGTVLNRHLGTGSDKRYAYYEAYSESSSADSAA